MMNAVAPLVGAWIEILSSVVPSYHLMSLPLWERGLKFPTHANINITLVSLPLWERGLKFE